MLTAVILAIAAFIVGYFVGRNNPNLSAVNKLLTAKKIVVTAAGAIAKAV